MTNQNKTNDIRTPSIYSIRSKTKMKPFNFNQNPEDIAKTFSQYVRAIVQVLIWATIGLASFALTCVAIGGILAAVKFALKVIF